MMRRYNVKNLMVYKDILTGVMAVSIIALMILLFTAYGLYKDRNETLLSKMETITCVEGLDLSLLCNIAGCKYVYSDKNVYKNNLGILELCTDSLDLRTAIFDMNSDGDSIINFKGSSFVVENTQFFGIVNNLIITSMVIFIAIFTALYGSKIFRDTEIRRFKSTTEKQKLESLLQRNLTESLHHELSVPISVIETLTNDLFRKLYPCDKSPDGKCKFINIDGGITATGCPSCETHFGRRDIDNIALDHYRKIMFSVDTLTTIKNLVSDSKHIKYSNGTVAIKDIIDNIIATSNLFRAVRVNSIYKDGVDVLEANACGRGLANGELMLIVNTLVINAMEAKSTSITVSAEFVGDCKMAITITDNGTGIRGRDNAIINNYRIFDYGYTTKDGTVTSKYLNKLPTRLVSMLVDFGVCEDIQSARGSGLAIARKMINVVGGDLELISTSFDGTTFKITMPTKPRKDVYEG